MTKNKLAGSLLAAAMALAAGFEGVKYVAYQDVGGVWTICYGETLGVKSGDTATPEQCKSQLIAGLLRHNAPFEKLPRQLPANVHLAALDFCYNVGVGNCTSSTLWRHLQTGRYDEACQQFTRWRYAAGRDCSQAGSQCRGVWERRKLERDICTGAVSIEQAAARLGQKLEAPDNATAN